MKQLKDFLHLYIGCEMICIADINEDFQYKGRKSLNTALLLDRNLNGKWKPALRPLSSMTESEKDVLYRLQGFTHQHEANRTCYLLSKYFDVFYLIEQGLAIDATTLQKEVQP